jgi:hypothetical protein
VLRASICGVCPAANTSKPIQAKMLGFAWFYSSEPGLFNGLPRKKQKNPLLPLFAERRRAGRERESGAPERI